eukprot:scaffold22852_cov88-Isochrysis_galbana.AAC.5
MGRSSLHSAAMVAAVRITRSAKSAGCIITMYVIELGWRYGLLADRPRCFFRAECTVICSDGARSSCRTYSSAGTRSPSMPWKVSRPTCPPNPTSHSAVGGSRHCREVKQQVCTARWTRSESRRGGQAVFEATRAGRKTTIASAAAMLDVVFTGGSQHASNGAIAAACLDDAALCDGAACTAVGHDRRAGALRKLARLPDG